MKLKVCGMKYNPAEVAALEPDYLGFIFWEPSARYFDIGPSNVPRGSERVGVFVDAALEEVINRVFEFELNAVQLHGSESPDYCSELKNLLVANELSNISVFKAFAVDENFDFSRLNAYDEVCDYFLFDTRGELPGGTGKRFDWNLLRDYKLSKPFLLSGGIGPDDAEALLEFFNRPEAQNCMGIDVNSKFEIKPGLKDTEALKIFKVKLASGLKKN